MPTYKNNGSKIAWIGSVTVRPDETRETAVYADPGHTDLELVSHSPRSNYPVKLFGDVLPSGAISDLARYGVLQIYNKTGEDITVTWNNDTTDQQVFPNGWWGEIDLNGDYDSIAVTGNGSGNVYLWAYR
jgi:hypothetical protein